MKQFCVILASLTCVAALWSQSTSTQYETDINGRRQAVATSAATKDSQTQLYQTVNGRRVPVEQTTEHVLTQTANSKTSERIVQRYDRNGNLASTQRVLIEEKSRPGGAKTVNEKVYYGEAYGTMQETERRTTETQVRGQTTTSNVVIARPTLNGGFSNQERRTIVTTGPENRQQKTETVSRPTGNGTFQEMIREVTTVTQQGNQTSTDTAIYEPNAEARLTLSKRIVSTKTETNGVVVTDTNLYANSIPGIARPPGSPMQVYEQQQLVSRPLPDGSIADTLSIRRPTLADPNRLGASELLSETICVGKCREEAPAETQQAAAAPAGQGKGAQGKGDQGKGDQGKAKAEGKQGDQAVQATAATATGAGTGAAPTAAAAKPAASPAPNTAAAPGTAPSAPAAPKAAPRAAPRPPSNEPAPILQ